MAEHNKEASPQTVEAFNKANAAFKKGEWQAALQCCDDALKLDATLLPAALLKARCLVRMGEWMPAREAFAQTLRLDPHNYSAWLEAGHLCKQMGELGQASVAYQRAIDAVPTRYEALLGMARVMALQGQQEAANRAYNDAAHAALATGGDAPRQVHWLMGQYVLEMGHAAESLVCFDHALKAAKTETPEALTNLRAEVQMDAAKAYLVLGQRDAAIRLLTLASAATQEATLSRLAALSFRNNFWQEAIEVSRRCVGLFAQSQWAHWNLAHLLAECWQMEEAEEVLQRAEAIAPMPGARSLRASVAGRVGDADAALALYTELAKESAADATFASSAAMSSLYSDKLSAQAVADLHRSLFASWGKGARSRESFVRKPREGRRLRLGIVSADFHHQHPVNIFMQPVLRELDRTRFELFMYFVGDSHDEQTALARSRVAHWQEVGALNTTQLAKRIDADEMLVEAYVKPSEVAFLHVGQKAVVKLSSYDFNKYGGLDGELEHLSPDTLKDERQQRKPGGNPVDMEEGYYRILVRIKDTHLVRNGKRLEPTPGMTATVEIRTGQKTVLEYLFRPLQNVSQALRER